MVTVAVERLRAMTIGYVMARIGLLLSCLVLTGSLAACRSGESPPATGMTSHRDSAGFSFAYPKEWRSGPRPLLAKARYEVMVLPSGTTIPDIALDTFVEPSEFGVERDVSDFIALSRNNDSIGNYRLVSSTKRMISGNHEAYVVVQTYTTRGDGGVQLSLRQSDLLTSTPRGDSIDVRLTCRNERVAKYEHQVAAVLDSVRVGR